MYRLLFILCFLLILPQVHSQDYIPVPVEDSLFQMFMKFPRMGGVEEMQGLNDNILDYMEENLTRPQSLKYRFDSLKQRAGIIDAEDGFFRIITWNLPLNAWEHEYYGIIQVYHKEIDSCIIHRLNNRLVDIPDILHARTDASNWPGALYYDVIRKKNGRELIYTLIGFNFNDRFSDKKIIDVLHFDEEKNPWFGKNVFTTPLGMQHRVIFEYSGEVAMNLRYNQDLKMIVYDHLEPIEPELKNFPRYYAPDFSYDGYKFRRGLWEYKADLDVRNR